MQPVYRKAKTGASYEIQRSQLIKHIKPILVRFPFLLVNRNISVLTILNKLEHEHLNWEDLFDKIDNEGFGPFIETLFQESKIENKKLIFMSEISLSRCYRNEKTGQKVITYASAKHMSGGKLTGTEIVIFRDAVDPQPHYNSMKVEEFTKEFKIMDL